MSNVLDIVLFGASGFTGTYCIESLRKLAKLNGRAFTWGVAGRSERKLKDALNEIGGDLSTVPIIIADADDPASLRKMTARARIVINCCGPFRFYGEAVIKACIETGTHHVDVSGEPQYMETIQYKYHEAAREKGIYIVSACGFDSIPAELGVLFLQDKFEGTVNSIESYLQFFGGSEGSAANFATYESAVHGVGSGKELGRLRKKLYPVPLPKFRPRLQARPPVHKSSLIDAWCIPFMGADRSVVQRTQRHLFDAKKTRPAQIHTYLGLQSFCSVALMVILGSIFAFLAKYKFGRSLLLKYPRVFTAGYVTHERPSKAAHSLKTFTMTFHARGWGEKLSDAADEFNTPPNKEMVVRLSAGNPGYALTGDLVTLAAIVVLSEGDKLPNGGGVYTPGIAFKDTSLAKLTQDIGLTFEVL